MQGRIASGPRLAVDQPAADFPLLISVNRVSAQESLKTSHKPDLVIIRHK